MTLRNACVALLLLVAGRPAARAHGQTTVLVKVSSTFKLNNGMRVTLVHVGAEKKAFVSLVLENGEIDEPAFGPGLAELTADMLLQGSVSRSAKQIATETASIGATINVRAGPVTTTISGEVPSANVPHFVTLISDLVRHPLLDTAAFERVRRASLRTLDSTMHSAGDLARQQWRAIVFPDGPFGHPYAVESTLRQLKLGHVRNVYDDSYAASHAHIYVSGTFVDAVAEKAIRESFTDWTIGLPTHRKPMRAATVHELATLDLPGADRSVTWIGAPVSDPADREFAALEVADMLVAGADSSRVALDIASIEQAPPRGSSTLWQRRTATYWVDVIDVHTANTGAAIGALLGELSVLMKEPPAEEEVAKARRRVIAAFDARSKSREGMVSMMEFMEEHGLGDGWRSGYAARVLAVTPEDVRAAVANHLDPAHMAIAVVGDRASIEPQLARLRPLVP